MFRQCLFLRRGPDVSLQQFKGIVLTALRATAAAKPAPSGHVLVDVRGRHELAKLGRVPAAVHIPLPELQNTLLDAVECPAGDAAAAIGPPGRQHLVFFCQAGVRSLQAVEIAEACGFNSVSHFPGGFSEYVRDPVTDKDVTNFVAESETK